MGKYRQRGNSIMDKFHLNFRLLIMDDLNLAYRGAMSNNKASVLNGAYHAQQAIEKTIKLKVSVKYGKNLWGHKIEDLIADCNKRNFNINVPYIIRKRADLYSKWEAQCRYYPQTVVRRDSILAAVRVCYEWLNGGCTKLPEKKGRR